MKEKSFERKNELLESALNEFSQKSYDEASVNQIIKDAGISKGTFYYHFQDKKDLYLFLIKSLTDKKWDFINSMLKNQFDQKYSDIFEKFKMQARIGIMFAKQHPKYHALAKMVAKERSNGIYESIQQMFDQSKQLNNMVDQAIENKDFADHYSKEFIIKIMSFMLAHYDDIFQSENDALAFENLDRFIEFLKNGVGRKQEGQNHG